MTERLWNGQPFKNYWNECSVEKRSEFIIKSRLEGKVKTNYNWEDIETHQQALLRDSFRSEVENE